MTQQATMSYDEPLFNSAHAALVYAYSFSTQASPPKTPVAKLMQGPTGEGKGLAGIDGAAQAGMIRNEVVRLGKIAEAIIVSRNAPRWSPCSCRAACCSGRKLNREWIDAISTLADNVRTTALHGCTSNGLMRREYVIRYFTRQGERVSLEALADKYDMDRKTAGAHAGRVVKYLRTLEHAAEGAINDSLVAAGLIE